MTTYRKKVIVIGGGTISYVRNHLALCMPAFGETARELYYLADVRFPDMDVELHLTKMADSSSKLVTNEDVSKLVDEIILDTAVKVVFFNVGLCDFTGSVVADDKNSRGDSTTYSTPSGKYEPRLKSQLSYEMYLHPADKLVGKIRKSRKDIFLVAFKTTCNASEQDQYIAGLNLLKANSCNLVLANDTGTRVNMIITPEEAKYHVTTDRLEALTQLVDMTYLRSHLTFTRSTIVSGEPIPWSSPLIPENLRSVVNYCVGRGAYKPFRGATVGHFACQIGPQEFLTSIRKSNFNDIETKGLVRITTDGPDNVIAYGARPSVGGQSQRIVFTEHEGYDCIVHFHCPILEGSTVPQVSQREYECGSHECGKNTSDGLQQFTVHDILGNPHVIKAVFLKEHGPNIVFNKDTPAYVVSQFIEQNFDLVGKTGGYVNDVKLPEEYSSAEIVSHFREKNLPPLNISKT